MEAFMNSLLEVSLISSVIIFGLLLLSPLLARKYASKSLCLIWLLLALRLLIPFNFHLERTIIEIPRPVQSSAISIPEKDDTAGAAVQSPVVSPAHEAGFHTGVPAAPGHIAAGTVIFFIWAAGALIFASLHFTGYVLLRRKIRRYVKPIEDMHILEAFDDMVKSMAIRPGRVAILKSSGLQSPMLTGFTRPVIILPDTGGFDTISLGLIIRHELTHYKRKDIWLKLLLTCANAVHWFNPLAYLMVREADRQIENACDQELIKNGDLQLRKEYSESILSAIALGHTRRYVLSTYFYGGKQTMKQRFQNIFDLKAKKRGAPVVAAVIIVLLVSGLLVSCSTTAKSPVSPSGSGTSASPSDAGASHAAETPSASDGASPAERDLAAVTETAKTWAEAVKNRDGKAQYNLMTEALQDKVQDIFAGLNWVTGTSSPWVASYEVKNVGSASTDSAYAKAEVLFSYETSTGPAGTYSQELTFKKEADTIKIDSISEPQGDPASPSPSGSAAPGMKELTALLGMTKEELTKAVAEKPVTVDEGGLGFDKTGIRVWFDTETYTKVAQVLILSDQIDIDGLKLGDSYTDFKAKFGEPVSDKNGDAHFKYGDVYLSVVRDTATDKAISVYILAEDF